MKLTNDQKVGITVIAVILAALSGFAVVVGAYIYPNGIEHVTVAEVTLTIESPDLKVARTKSLAFCDDVKRRLIERGIDEEQVRILSVTLTKNSPEQTTATISSSLKQLRKNEDIEINQVMSEVSISDIDVVEITSSDMTLHEYHAWKADQVF